MRNLLSTALLLAATLSASAQNDLKSVLSQLDATLAHRDSYIAGREQRIESLKNILRKSDFSDAQRYILNQQLIDEYTPYQADSTIDYLYRNIALATRMNDAGHLNESRIQLAYLYSSAGIYLEAANMLKLVDTTALDRRQLVDYYIARHKLNDELQLYSHDSAQGHESWRLTEIYARLIVDNTEPESPTHLNFRLRQAIGARDYPQAVEISERLCSTLQPLSREYAEASYMRALVADLMDDTPTAQVWFARSAMTDIQLAIRDNAALKSLANTLLDDDNIQRAMRYMRIVMDDARFFNSRLRPWQDALALHVIEEAYRVRRQRMDTMYNIFVLSIAGFMLLAVGGVIFVLRQNRKLSLARLELQQANNRLNISNKDLQHINKRLAGLNSQISEANEVKEEYIGIFLTMCSEYIDKIIDSRRHVRRLLRDGRVDELRKEYSPTDGDSRELEEFYHNFDTTFLQLYPTFIEDFNSLLDREARIEPKKGELLTTELRIFALIRLGINDSSKIAALLRYSVSTIYNYRSKIKGHTLVSRDDFEERIKTIGAFSP
ncbi:MAG: transcriptional regulator [Alistipes shahii]|nr:transcriptional regulator [Alistipes shahii]